MPIAAKRPPSLKTLDRPADEAPRRLGWAPTRLVAPVRPTDELAADARREAASPNAPPGITAERREAATPAMRREAASPATRREAATMEGTAQGQRRAAAPGGRRDAAAPAPKSPPPLKGQTGPRPGY